MYDVPAVVQCLPPRYQCQAAEELWLQLKCNAEILR
jgi:hypothetical protein